MSNLVPALKPQTTAKLFVLLWTSLVSSCILPHSAPAQTTDLVDSKLYEVKSMRNDQWQHYRIYINGWHSNFEVTLVGLSGNPDVYVRKWETPTLTQWDFRPHADGNETVEVSNDATIPLDSGWYYISVHANPTVNKSAGGGGPGVIHSFKISASRTTEASIHKGMGAIPYEGGTAFRVWAPNAKSVHVAGEFNGWSSSNAQLVDEGKGHWSIDFRNAVPGHEYKYVIRNGTQELWRNDPREEEITNSTGNSVIFDPAFSWTDGSFTMPNWNELVVYEMHVGTLNDTPGGLPGSFDSAIHRLDHIKDLGINAVSVMPINEFAGDFSWGYNPSHPFSVESIYGGPKEFKRFVDEAHSRGIAVFLDLVHNHYGPSDLNLWRFDGWSEGEFGGIFFYQDSRSQTQWGDTRPDFGRNEVRQFIRDNALMWLQDFHVDGLRFDSTLNIHTSNWGDNADGWSLLQWINDEIDATQPWKFSFAEDLQNNSYISKNTSAGGAGFDSQWSAGFVHPIRAALEASDDSGRDMFAVRDAIAEQFNGEAFQRMIYTESHDEVANGRARVPEDIWPGNAASWPSQKRSTLGGVITMTAPGVPMIFQGQEVLEDGFFHDDDPVDWNKESTFSGIELLYRDAIRLRRNWFNNTRGLRGQSTNVFHVNNNDKVIAYHRWDQGGAGDDVIVVCNFSTNNKDNYRIGLPGPGVWRVRFNSDWNGYSGIFGNTFTADVIADDTDWDGQNFSGVINRLGAYTGVILSQDSAETGDKNGADLKKAEQ